MLEIVGELRFARTIGANPPGYEELGSVPH